jgi:uncharacterized protein (DUF488 family)
VDRAAGTLPVFTIGHSTRPIDEFAAMLQAAGVRLLIDVRSIPRSRTNPQYNLDRLSGELAPWQISHRYVAELGGRRPKSPDVPPELNAFWRNQSFHNYADYALSEAFEKGLGELTDAAAGQRTAIMCAEAVWWRCHRRIIADYLIAQGVEVFHLMGPGKTEAATITPGARPSEGKIIYPPNTQA